MKLFHTADWHLGKLVQGVSMTDEQRFVLQQFTEAIEEEKPDAVIIAGDLYDRAVPPTDAVNLLDEVLETIVLKMKTPVIAVSGNHDSPGRLNFGSRMMKSNGFYITGQLKKDLEPIVLLDAYGEVHFHLVPYADPSQVRHVLDDAEIRTHDDAMKKMIAHIESTMDPSKRHVLVGHAFVTPHGEEEENTSDSERPLAIGGAEFVSASHFKKFHYTALGHLHQAHFVLNETIRYAGSPLKYSISEEHHKKGFHIVEMDELGNVTVEKRLLTPNRDIRTVEGKMEDILQHKFNEDYVFVRLLDETPILFPMEKVRSVYPNAMHVERKVVSVLKGTEESTVGSRRKMDDLSLFNAFYEEVKGVKASEETALIFKEVLQDFLHEQQEFTGPAKKEGVKI
ncbi:exonuclease SbcCD subunit D [Paenisporosarcina quisquiliarum]|uniref:Nuclease SbcCD subunit D n=1 Tax=Paenisporosarcina quisquiliarum TaxID=365346 RepID=A0A9X3LH80_9BACL|nr:exonuclease SbcCD subunit D [Paenisporosarcina quisquiliarum]MCZ8537868.1 exonuclease SbcCD subunit D [Paenisporosarcina quisquiliarum]